MNIVDALTSDELFGSLFAPLSTWSRWLTLAKAAYGLPLDATELEDFCRFTGRTRVLEGGYAEVVDITGRQSGKTRIASTIASFEALLATKRPGEPAPFSLLVAQDFRGALRASFAYASEAFSSVPALARAVVAKRGDTLELENGCILACYPCRPDATRGIRAVVVVCDELAFFRSSDGYPRDVEMLRAVRPTLATTGGRLFALSSPYGQSGALWDLHRRHYGVDDSTTLVWQASAPEMNPTLPADYLERMRRDDPEAAAAEIDGFFRAGLSLLFDPEAIDACVIPERREIAPSLASSYCGFADPSGGRSDAFTAAVAHRMPDATVVLDAVRRWPAPFSPEEVTKEAADFFRSYRLSYVQSDRYAGEWPAQAFAKHGIRCVQSAAPKSDLYLDLLPRVNSGTVELLDHPDLLRELRGLERRRGTAKDRVDHRVGGHDDVANAAAGAISIVGSRTFRGPDHRWL